MAVEIEPHRGEKLSVTVSTESKEDAMGPEKQQLETGGKTGKSGSIDVEGGDLVLKPETAEASRLRWTGAGRVAQW